MLVELYPCIHVRSLDRIKQKLSNTHTLNVDQVWLEQSFWSLEALTTDFDDTTIR